MARWKRWLSRQRAELAWRLWHLQDRRWASTVPRPAVAIIAIFRNEAPYVLEWLAWHRLLGVQDFFIADNNSDDGTTDLLAALAKAGLVTHIPYPGTPGRPPQFDAYRDLMAAFGHRAEWFGFFDADEFIRPLPEANGQRLADWLSSQPRDTGAVFLNWACFGSSGRVDPGQGLVTERFLRRGLQDFDPNRHIKSFVRARAWRGVAGNPHAFPIAPRALQRNSAGTPVSYREIEHAFSNAVVWGAFRQDHYCVKSRTEFIHKKVARGRSDTLKPEFQRNLAFFEEYDVNTVEDPQDPAMMAALKDEIARIRGLLAAQGVPDAVIDPPLPRAEGRSAAS